MFLIVGSFCILLISECRSKMCAGSVLKTMSLGASQAARFCLLLKPLNKGFSRESRSKVCAGRVLKTMSSGANQAARYSLLLQPLNEGFVRESRSKMCAGRVLKTMSLGASQAARYSLLLQPLNEFFVSSSKASGLEYWASARQHKSNRKQVTYKEPSAVVGAVAGLRWYWIDFAKHMSVFVDFMHVLMRYGDWFILSAA